MSLGGYATLPFRLPESWQSQWVLNHVADITWQTWTNFSEWRPVSLCLQLEKSSNRRRLHSASTRQVVCRHLFRTSTWLLLITWAWFTSAVHSIPERKRGVTSQTHSPWKWGWHLRLIEIQASARVRMCGHCPYSLPAGPVAWVVTSYIEIRPTRRVSLGDNITVWFLTLAAA